MSEKNTVQRIVYQILPFELKERQNKDIRMYTHTRIYLFLFLQIREDKPETNKIHAYGD